MMVRSAAVLTALAGVGALEPSCDNGCAVGPFPAVCSLSPPSVAPSPRRSAAPFSLSLSRARSLSLALSLSPPPLSLSLSLTHTQAENMNGDYTVAGNPKGFSTKSADYDPGHIEYFDVCVSPSLSRSLALSLSLCVCVCVCARARARVLRSMRLSLSPAAVSPLSMTERVWVRAGTRHWSRRAIRRCTGP